jgi:replication initiation protein RepC
MAKCALYQVHKRTVVSSGNIRPTAQTNLRDKTMHQITSQKTIRKDLPTSTDLRWASLNAVQSAMKALGLRDRDITVLRGLLTFIIPDKWSEKLMVYASNASLQARCDGIDERTLRRHLARLCEVGLIIRHQSPNRKRYIVRGVHGQCVLSYGFDLGPLRDNLAQIHMIAEEQRASDLQVKVLKALLRDRLYKLAQCGSRPETAEDSIGFLQKLLRRKVDVEALEAAIEAVENQLPNEAEAVEISTHSSQMSDSDGQNVRHIQSSKKEYIEESSCALEAQNTNVSALACDITLTECIEAARSAMEFSQERPKTWTDVARLAHQLAPAIGIQTQQLLRTREALGERGASLAILGLVEAYARIKEPVRYLNALVTKASKSGLNLVRMFRSLTTAPRFPAGNRGACPA